MRHPGAPDFDGAWPTWVDSACATEFVELMVDDLHVRRLRQIWNHIVTQLGVASGKLKVL